MRKLGLLDAFAVARIIKAANLQKEVADFGMDVKRRQEEAERRRKLLEDVANSLQNTDSTNMTSGTEDLIDYDYESELD